MIRKGFHKHNAETNSMGMLHVSSTLVVKKLKDIVVYYGYFYGFLEDIVHKIQGLKYVLILHQTF